MLIFSYPSVLTHVLGAQKKCLIETVLLSKHNICFGWEIRKIIFNYALILKLESWYGPRREKSVLRGLANNTGADQPAHLRSLISAFVILFLESFICILAAVEISIF